MSYTLEVFISDAAAQEFARDVESELAPLLREAESAMAARFHEITLGNFGEGPGVDRPLVWPALSAAYARRVKRDYATLFVHGVLYDAVKLDAANARVSVSDADCEYATVHQWGGGNNVPARPYLPIYADGTVTAYTTEECRAAAERALNRLLEKR